MSKSLKKLIDINRLREFKNKLVGTGSAYVQTGAVDQTVAGTKTFSKPIVGSVTGSSGSCTGNAATATTATTAKSCTGNAATATKLATARSLWGNNFDGSAAITGQITGTPAIELEPKSTTANNGGFLDFHYNQSTADYTSRIIESSSGTLSINNVTITTGKVVTAKTFNGALKGNVTGNCSGSSGSCTGNAATATNATNATYANWLRTSSHSDHLFHTEWDNAGYFWTYVTTGGGEYRAVRVARSDSAANADHAIKAAYDSNGNHISTTYVKRTDIQNFNVGASFIGFYSSVSRINGVGNGGRLTVGDTTSASNLYDTITTANNDTVVCSRNIALAGTWKLMSIIRHDITSSKNFSNIEATRGGILAVQGLFVRIA